MELPIPFGAYTGKSTPFGGASLEHFVEHHPSIDYDKSKGARLSTTDFPQKLKFMLFNVAGKLPDRFFTRGRRSVANAERLVVSFGLDVLESIINQYPSIKEKENVSVMTTPFALLIDRDERHFRINLGPSIGSPRPTISFCDMEEVARLCTLATEIVLPSHILAKLCLIIGLAQSIDLTWVREDWKTEFIQEVKRFKAKLEEWNR